MISSKKSLGLSGMAFIPKNLQREPMSDEAIAIQKKKGFDRWLPYPVSANSLHTIRKGYSQSGEGASAIILTQAARQYYSEVCRFLQDNECPTLTGRLRVEIYLHDPDLRKRDINNYTKSLLDALEQGKVFVDDEQIDETFIYRKETRRGGAVRVKIQEIEGAPERRAIKDIEKEQQQLNAEKSRDKLLKQAYGKEAVEEKRLFQVIRPGTRSSGE